MRIISHRGFWIDPSEKNGWSAFERSIRDGFGTETDLRDGVNGLVVSHDPPVGGEMGFDLVVKAFAAAGLPLAVNVKADGLAQSIKSMFSAHSVEWFAFDMSAPELYRYLKLGLPCFTRHSDIEPQPICYSESKGVWLDAFGSDWYGPDVVTSHINNGKQVCIVSSDLHGRDHASQWAMLREANLHRLDDLIICTDHPLLARSYFGVTDEN